MLMQSLAGVWKLRPEFLDVEAAHFNQVLSRPDGKFEMLNMNTPRKPKPFPKKEGFLDANVPCDVITALMDNGIIEEPLVKDNTERLLWLMDFSWWFIRDFDISDEMYANEQIRLFIDMLDFKANIILNGVPAFEHKNTFCAFNEDIKRFIKRGKNQIIIRITNGVEDHYDAADSMSYYSTNGMRNQRTFLRKPQFTYGWDWCKPLPTCGIGRDIHLEGLTGAKITAFRADTLSIDGNGAKVRVHFEIDNVSVVTSDDAVLKYELSFDGQTVYTSKKELHLPGGLSYYEDEIFLEDAKLWWPNGYGDANLYTANASVECRESMNTMDEKLIGIRTIAIDHSKRNDGTRNYRFVVNGVNVFCKGGNWVPTDSVYMRTPDEKYRVLVEEAKEQNFTMLRMWGGGTYEPTYFYDQCSKNGIMLMHDFMYACAYYPDYLDWFAHEAEKEAQYQTKRLAHHACMAIWTGNNEIHEEYTDWHSEEVAPAYYYGYKIFNYIQPKAVRDNSPLIPYAPCSPFFGDRANDPYAGDVHIWGLMRKLQNGENVSFADMRNRPMRYEVYDEMAEIVRFSSEYGFHGPLMRSSVDRYHDDEAVSFNSASWQHHDGYKGRYLLQSVGHNLVPNESLDEDGYLLYAGIMHGVNYREMAEALRRREHCSGDLIWMYNDCWPETGWTTVDYYLTRKISFYFVKRAFATKKLIIRVFDGKGYITALNESNQEITAKLEYGYMTFDGKATDVKTAQITMNKHSFNEIPSFDAQGDLTKGFYYVKAMDEDGFVPATSLRAGYRGYDFSEFKAAITQIKKVGSNIHVTIKSETYVPFVQLVCADDRTKMCDNYFEMLPGMEKTVCLYDCAEEPTLNLVKVIRDGSTK